MKMKTTRTFSVDEKKYEKYELICKTLQINKSILFEDAITQFINDNYGIFIVNKTFRLKNTTNNNASVVSVDNGFVKLSNGNVMNINDFELLYEEIDTVVLACVNAINNVSEDIDDVKIIEEDILDQSCIDINKVVRIINDIEPDKIDWNIDVNFINKMKDEMSEMIREDNEEKRQEFIASHIKENSVDEPILNSHGEPIYLGGKFYKNEEEFKKGLELGK